MKRLLRALLLVPLTTSAMGATAPTPAVASTSSTHATAASPGARGAPPLTLMEMLGELDAVAEILSAEFRQRREDSSVREKHCLERGRVLEVEAGGIVLDEAVQ